MSHIDSFQHRHVGNLLGRYPVYQALEDINGDFQALSGQLILGGGSGEHPAMVVNDAAACVAALYWLEDNSAKIAGVRDDLCFSYERVFTFYQWFIEDFHHFFMFCESSHQQWHYADEGSCIEQWLMCQMGALIYQHCPELLPNWAKRQRVISKTTLVACSDIELARDQSH